jgi:imidazole glycerol-phosphate synthase subunit HisF
MKKKRLIPILLLKNGWLVQSKEFSRYQNFGNPTTAVQRISEWGSDELIYLDISKDGQYDIRRNDQNYPNRQTFLEIIEDVSKVTFMPITVGGKIKSLKDIEERLKLGADKITLNTMAINNSEFISIAAKEFGSQCIVVSIDAKIKEDNYYVYDHKKSSSTFFEILDFSKRIESLGAGEILLNSVDRDGLGGGYDLGLIKKVSNKVNIPVISCGGVSEWSHFLQAFEKTEVDAVAAANIFHYRDQSVYLAKKYLHENKSNVRKPDLLNLMKEA